MPLQAGIGMPAYGYESLVSILLSRARKNGEKTGNHHEPNRDHTRS